MARFKASDSTCKLTEEQQSIVDLLEGSFLKEYDIGNLEFRLEREGWRLLDNTDINKLKECLKSDFDLTECIKKYIICIINNGGRYPLLGQYHYDRSIEKGVITLYIDHIKRAAHEYNIKSTATNEQSYPDMKNILPLITGYVFIHELFHAYFDKYHMPKVKEIEEAMAEYASLDFLENTHNTCHDIAYEMVSLKKEICIWISAYGFGEYLHKNDFTDSRMIEKYAQINHLIFCEDLRVKEFVKGFVNGYPWGKEAKYYMLLKSIIFHPTITVHSDNIHIQENRNDHTIEKGKYHNQDTGEKRCPENGDFEDSIDSSEDTYRVCRYNHHYLEWKKNGENKWSLYPSDSNPKDFGLIIELPINEFTEISFNQCFASTNNVFVFDGDSFFKLKQYF